jgi:rubrerythrin
MRNLIKKTWECLSCFHIWDSSIKAGRCPECGSIRVHPYKGCSSC